jgi:hypothetical protein
MYYSAEQLLQNLSAEDLYTTLKSLNNEDSYLIDYIVDDLAGDFIYMLEVYDLVWLASDDRILLTTKGEKVLQLLANTVELSKKQTKIRSKKL